MIVIQAYRALDAKTHSLSLHYDYFVGFSNTILGTCSLM
jgi:hypothetical protein